jgi:prevent-host-death family protein
MHEWLIGRQQDVLAESRFCGTNDPQNHKTNVTIVQRQKRSASTHGLDSTSGSQRFAIRPSFSRIRFDIVANNSDALMGLSKALLELVNMAKNQEKTVNVSEARTHWYELLRMAESGTEIPITKHGTPLAKLMPLANPTRRPKPKAHDSTI